MLIIANNSAQALHLGTGEDLKVIAPNSTDEVDDKMAAKHAAVLHRWAAVELPTGEPMIKLHGKVPKLPEASA